MNWDVRFYDWAMKKFLEMKGIDDPDRTAMSMVKGVMESDNPESLKIARVQAIIQALEDTK